MTVPHDDPAGAPRSYPADTETTAVAPRPAPGAPAAGFDDKGHVRRSRISAAWAALLAVAVFLVLLIIFIGQNLTKGTIHFLGFSGHLPIGLIALVAAVLGVVTAAIPGTLRIFQLRRALKRNTPRNLRA